MRIRIKKLFIPHFILAMLFCLMMLPQIVLSGEVISSAKDKAVIDTRCLDVIMGSGIKNLLKPYGIGKVFTEGWVIKDYALRKEEIIFNLYNKDRKETLQVFLREKDRRSPAYEKTGMFNIQYRGSKNLQISKDEDKALMAFVKIIQTGERQEPKLLSKLENASKVCPIAKGKTFNRLGILSGNAAVTEGAVGQGKITGQKESQSQNMVGAWPFFGGRIFGIPLYIPLILIILIGLYILTWWYEKRGTKG